MGHELQTPLLSEGPPPSAPPLGFQQQTKYPHIPPPGKQLLCKIPPCCVKCLLAGFTCMVATLKISLLTRALCASHLMHTSTPCCMFVPCAGLLQPPAGYPGPSVMDVPAPPQQQHMAGPQMMLLHHQMAPPPQSAMDSHTVHVHLTEDPTLTRIQAAPRLHVCPACHSTGPTLVSSGS
jgi:hypothetical protein